MIAIYNPATRRHSWEKLQPHGSRCRFCQLAKTSVELAAASAGLGGTGRGAGLWVTRWTTAAGVVSDSRTAAQPDCPGPGS